MLTSEHTSEQAKLKEALPTSVSLSAEDCLAPAKELKGKVVVVTGESAHGGAYESTGKLTGYTTGAGAGFGRSYSLLAASHGQVEPLLPLQVETAVSGYGISC